MLGLDLDAPLLLGLMGGLHLALVMGVCVSAPLVVSAALWHLIRRSATGKVALPIIRADAFRAD